MNTLSKMTGAAVLAAHLVTVPVSVSAEAIESHRKGLWEFMLSPQYTLAKNLGFDGGTTAKIDDTFGFGLQIGYNFNDHWNLAGLFSWSQPDYHAQVQPVAGNPLPARSTNGTIQTNTFGLALTYNFLKGPLTPYVDAMLGGTHVNTEHRCGSAGHRLLLGSLVRPNLRRSAAHQVRHFPQLWGRRRFAMGHQPGVFLTRRRETAMGGPLPHRDSRVHSGQARCRI